MSGRGKRIWAPRLGFEEAYKETLRFSKRSSEHNILQKYPPTLYRGYLMEGAWPVDGMEEISRYLRFGYDHQPQTDRGRMALVRLLAVAVRAHFFLREEAIVPHEPYVFTLPDLALGGQLRYGLLYPLEHQGKLETFLVAECDLALASSRYARVPAAQRFPVVLGENPFHWLPLKQWREAKEKAQHMGWLGADSQRGKLIREVKAHEDVATFPYGTLLDYPKELNTEVMDLGGMWANGVERWFLPLGYDSQAAKEYLDYIHRMSPAEQYEHRWWRIERAPRSEK